MEGIWRAFSAINSDQKQHLNLSSEAWEVMDDDMFAFQTSSRSAFLNCVIANFREDADATIISAVNRQRRAWCAILPQALGDTQAAVSALAEEYRARLLEKALSYPKGESLKFRINNENFAYLTNGSLCSEELNYGENHMGTYLKAIVEEYAAKSYLERERIYLRPWFDTIQDAIAAKNSCDCSCGIRPGNSSSPIE